MNETILLQCVNDIFRTDYTMEQLRSRCKIQRLADVRQMFIYIASKVHHDFDLSFTEIGRTVNRSHGTVWYSIQIIESRLSTSQYSKHKVQQAIDKYNELIKN